MMRPKHARRDANHGKIVADLRAAGCVVVDVSDLASDTLDAPLDLFVLAPDRGRWVQVEVKPGLDAPFTISERAYLRRVDCWPPEEPGAAPVIVACSAQRVLAWFAEWDTERPFGARWA
jgi:hypothetical protein